MKTCLRCREATIPASIDFCAECCGPELRIPFTTRPKPDDDAFVDQYVGELWCAHATAVAS